jgi:hypothetical protein
MPVARERRARRVAIEVFSCLDSKIVRDRRPARPRRVNLRGKRGKPFRALLRATSSIDAAKASGIRCTSITSGIMWKKAGSRRARNGDVSSFHKSVSKYRNSWEFAGLDINSTRLFRLFRLSEIFTIHEWKIARRGQSWRTREC